MEDDKIKARIGSNIAERRKRAGLTQAGLAERLNYSDKAVSKWERGESVPDVLTMMQLAELFGVRVDDLLQDPALSGSLSEEETNKPLASKRVIQALSTTLVWFVALFFFVVISSFGIPSSWVAFFYAIPANAIVLLCLRSAWHKYSWNKALISVIVWGSLASIPAGIPGRKRMEGISAGHPGPGGHFPVVPDVPIQGRKVGRNRW